MRTVANPNRRAHATANIYGIGSSSNSFGERDRLERQRLYIDRSRNSGGRAKLLADRQGNSVPGIWPLVRTGLCQGLRPVSVLVPSLLVGLPPQDRPSTKAAICRRPSLL
jgi:hypothetical protein